MAAAGLPVSISQKAKQDALEHADIIDSLKKGSVAIRKYDMTAAQAAGDYSEDMYVATGEKDTVAEQKLADYAMEGVQFSCLRVGNIETHTICMIMGHWMPLQIKRQLPVFVTCQRQIKTVIPIWTIWNSVCICLWKQKCRNR